MFTFLTFVVRTVLAFLATSYAKLYTWYALGVQQMCELKGERER
jgi:hypothetical protein